MTELQAFLLHFYTLTASSSATYVTLKGACAGEMLGGQVWLPEGMA